MSVICHHTMSLDGFIAGRGDSMDWAFAHGVATSMADETMAGIGAILAGRRWYDLAMERWEGVDGIYGGNYGGRVFVLTHPTARRRRGPEDQLHLGWNRGGGRDGRSRRRKRRHWHLRRQPDAAVPAGRALG